MGTMNISLTPQLEKLVQDRVRSGRYTSASEVMREARLAQLRTDVHAGLQQLDAGEASPFDAVAAGRIKQRGRVKLAESKGK